MTRVRMLQHFGVNPFLVFDGDYLPGKAVTEQGRHKRREEHRNLGNRLLKDGKLAQAHVEFQKSLDVTPEMARQLIDELKKCSVQYIVAPYEADSQMVYLETQGIISGIISEDSDLLVFGAKCLLTKLDQYGNCIELNKTDFSACKDINLAGWSDTAFRQMAILSGCDYLPSINNMGLKTAYRMIRRYKNIEKVIQMLQFDGKFRVPKGYLESFYQAEITFLHQRVFCPQARSLVFHTQPVKPLDLDNMPFIGAFVDPETALGVACGDLHPMTKLPFTVSKDSPVTLSGNPWSTALMSRNMNQHSRKESSLTNFFTKRPPLSDLDLNSVTPSGQHQLLEVNLTSQASDLLPHPCSNQEKTILNHSKTSISVEVNESFPVAPTSALPKHDSVQRSRLCSDTDPATSTGHSKLHSSPYFTQSSQEENLPLSKSIGSKRKKIQENYLFSNSSIKNAMLCMPSNHQSPTHCANDEEIVHPGQKIDCIITDNNTPLNSQTSITDSNNLEDSNYKLPHQLSINSSTFSPNLSQEKLVSSSNIPASELNFKNKPRQDIMVKEPYILTPPSSLQLEKSTTLPNSQTSKLNRSSKVSKKRLEPRQKTSNSIISIKSTNTPSKSKISIKPAISCAKQVEILPKQRANYDMTQFSSRADLENIFHNVSTGSEDLIIPDSEDESLSPIFTGKLTDYFS